MPVPMAGKRRAAVSFSWAIGCRRCFRPSQSSGGQAAFDEGIELSGAYFFGQLIAVWETIICGTQATISGNLRTIADILNVTDVLIPADSLRATYCRSDIVARAILPRGALTELLLPRTNVA
jgi:hypothetical protein